MTFEEIELLKEKEDKVEFKAAVHGNYSFSGGTKADPKERRKCILAYITAFANEGGGKLIFGVSDDYPHEIVGSSQHLGRLGELEQNVYRELKIRITLEEVFQGEKRILIIHIPGRPYGKVFKFEDVALMRVGEELLPMSDELYLKIVQEQEPDFSEQFCDDISIRDLDPLAIEKLKEAYSLKQNNPRFLTLSHSQLLSDLDLVIASRITYAALILLGKKEIIKKLIPQSKVIIEFRNTESQIVFDQRQFFDEPYFLSLEKIWNFVNARNGNVPVQQGLFIFDIPYFNKEVIREALNNAIAHRDYKRQGEVVIKQYPTGLTIINPGGFPFGVNKDNLLTVNSTPRNRRLSDILQKTGIVERSGQGVDKIFYQSLTEAKGSPDYSQSDDFQVELRLSSVVKDKAYALFINEVQKERRDVEKLSVKEIITLEKVRQGVEKSSLDLNIVHKLLAEGLVEKVGKTSHQKIILSKRYFSFVNKEAEYTRMSEMDPHYVMILINKHLAEFQSAKMSDFVNLFKNQLTREQVKNFIYNLASDNNRYLEFEGLGSGRKYFLGKAAVEGGKIYKRALALGMEQMKKLGEIEEKSKDGN